MMKKRKLRYRRWQVPRERDPNFRRMFIKSWRREHSRIRYPLMFRECYMIHPEYSSYLLHG
jgi:hypothetical protein